MLSKRPPQIDRPRVKFEEGDSGFSGGVSTLASQLKQEEVRLPHKAQALVQNMLRLIERVLLDTHAQQREHPPLQDEDVVSRQRKLSQDRQSCVEKLFKALVLKIPASRAKQLALSVEDRLVKARPRLGDDYLHAVRTLSNEFLKKGLQEADVLRLVRATTPELDLYLATLDHTNQNLFSL